MTAPRLLDVFCCQGGASAGYVRAGFAVEGIDHVFERRYPHHLHHGDALALLPELAPGFDVVHASPPCQPFSQCNNWERESSQLTLDVGPRHADLVDATRSLLDDLGVPYVLENVVGSPLRPDLMLCGTMFGLRVLRHRIFEFGGMAPPAAPGPCNHWSHVGEADPWRKRRGDTSQGALDRPKGAFVSPSGNPNREKGSVSEWLEAMDTPWMDRRGVTQAIPPAYTEHIGAAILRSRKAGET